MERVVNNNFTSDDYAEEYVQKVLSYANEFWGRKFIGLIAPRTLIGSDGRSWIVPVSAAWNESDSIPMNFNRDGQLKFQTDDGRWVTFSTLPLPGTRISEGNRLTYQWDDELFSNPNSHIDKDNNISIKSSLEIIDGFDEMEYWLEQFIVYLLNLQNFISVSSSLTQFIIANPDMSIVVRNDLIRLVNSISDDLAAIANGTLIYTDTVRNSFQKNFSDQYFVLTLATPLRVKKILEASGITTKTRLKTLKNTYLALLDQRETYGPWSNRDNATGRTDVIIDSSLTPWTFGYRGIINSTGMDLLDQIARAKIKTVADISLDAITAELEVAGVPAVNIGDQLQTTGVITIINIIFAINGIRTTYKARQWTNELSKYLRQQQDLIDKLRRQAIEFNNSIQPPPYNIFGEYLNVVNMSEKQTAPGRLLVGTDVQVNEFSVTDGGIVSYYIEISAPKPANFTATIVQSVSNSEPIYRVKPVSNSVQRLNLLSSELLDLNTVTNIGEPANYKGYLSVGTEVTISWNENADGSFTPFMEQQLNLFKPLD
jgi:hypothetical protein